MSLMPVTAEDMRAAQILTGATLALFLLVGLAPGMRAHGTQLRLVILAIYVLGVAALVIRALAR